MGVCHSKNGAKESGANKDIKKADALDAYAPSKILFLGAGDVGKSTFLKQIKCIHNGAYTQSEREDFIPVVHQNIITITQVLLQQLHLHPELQLSPQNQQFVGRISSLSYQDHDQDEDGNHLINEKIAFEINSLWQDNAIQRIFNTRREKGAQNCDVYDNAKYYLDQINAVSNKSYVPTDEDIIKCKARTTGIVESSVTVDDNKMAIYDLGGERAERRKWLRCRDNVNGIVYVASSSSYDQTLVEDESANRLTEEVKLFQDVCEMFPTKPIILLFTKKDILKAKLADNTTRPISDFHSSFTEGNYTDPTAWLENEFLSKAPAVKPTVIHIDTTDIDDARRAFTQVKNIVFAHSSE